MNIKKLVLVIALFTFVICFYFFDAFRFISFDYIKTSLSAFNDFYDKRPALAIAIFMIIYVVVTALSIPGAAVLTLLAGALFGLITGTVIVSFASTVGATLAFLMARFLIGNYVQERYGDKLTVINKGIDKEGWVYLLTLRMIPVFPFFVINLMMGITKIKVMTFFITSQIGMFAGTVAYVYAGQELAEIDSLQNIISLDLLIAFTIIGLLPLVMKQIVKYIKNII